MLASIEVRSGNQRERNMKLLSNIEISLFLTGEEVDC
jgi:hypothetical protein